MCGDAVMGSFLAEALKVGSVRSGQRLGDVAHGGNGDWEQLPD